MTGAVRVEVERGGDERAGESTGGGSRGGREKGERGWRVMHPLNMYEARDTP